MFSALNENSPRQESGLLVPAYAHQQSALHAMTRMEASCTEPLTISNTTTMETKIGILADKPGSGKSYTALSLIASKQILNTNINHDPRLINLEMMRFKICDSKFEFVLKTNLIICPKATHKQWADQCARFVPPSMSVFHTMKFQKSNIDDILNNKYDIAVLQENQYKTLLGRLDNMLDKYKFQRVFLDDADSISVPRFELPHANFVWLVSCMTERIRSGQVSTRGLKYICWNIARFNIQNVTVRNQDEFIDSSINLPPVQVKDVFVQYSNLRNKDDTDTNSLTAIVGCMSVPTIDDLISTMNVGMQNKIAALRYRLRNLPPHTHNDINKQIESIERELFHYPSRVIIPECPITMEDIKTRAVVPCCKRAFEFTSLLNAIETTNVCPVCRATLSMDELVVVNDIKTDGAEVYYTKALALKKYLTDIFAEDPHSKVFICGSNNIWQYFSTIDKFKLKTVYMCTGTGNAPPKLDAFNKGDVSIFTVDVGKVSVGMDLVSATHVINMYNMSNMSYVHALGRAQRIGRKAPLKVINIKYEKEVLG